MKTICITGSICTGKTTLATALGTRLARVELRHELAKRLALDFPSLDFADPDVRAFLAIQTLRSDLSFASSLCPHYRVLDTGSELNLVYDRLYGLARTFEVELVAAVGGYQHIFVCDPSDVAVVPDGLRSVDEGLRARAHDALLELLTGHGVEWQLVSGSVEDRLDSILSVL